jgi:hypothetical protein
MRFVLAASVAVQGFILWNASQLSLRESVQYSMALALLVAVVAEFWRRRRFLNPHADMLLIMFSLGGLGMALGGVSCHVVGWAEWLRMNGLMLGIGLGAAVPFSRCLQRARRDGRLFSTLVFDSVGMIGGMQAASLVMVGPLGSWAVILHYAAMMSGMIGGMGAAMVCRDSWLKALDRSEQKRAFQLTLDQAPTRTSASAPVCPSTPTVVNRKA